MAKNDFISDNLVHMRERLKENAAKMAASSGVPVEEEPKKAPKLSNRAVHPARTSETGRTDDSARRKREFAAKLERDRAAIAASIEVESAKLTELQRFEQTLTELDRAYQSLGPVDTPDGMRELEKLYFTHHRAAGRVSVYRGHDHTNGIAPAVRTVERSPRRSWTESLPLMIALIVSALIVAATLMMVF